MTTTPTVPPARSSLTRYIWLALSIFTSAPIAILYGLGARILFGGIPGLKLPDAINGPLSTLSVAFIFLVPLAIGALTVAFAPAEWRRSLIYALVMPFLNCLLWSAVVALLLWEAAICVAMALPLALPLAMAGGLAMWVVFTVVHNLRAPITALALIVILPYIAAPVERSFPIQNVVRTVEADVIIHAAPDAIWRNIVRVPEIQPAERDFRWFHVLGVPWPVEATLAHDGPGAVRAARYDNGLHWSGPVTDWQPDRTVAFAIRIQDIQDLPAPWNSIGPDFNIIGARYILEPRADGNVRLRLISEHRLSTRFNDYGGLWTGFFIGDIQAHILHVIKIRAEAGR